MWSAGAAGDTVPAKTKVRASAPRDVSPVGPAGALTPIEPERRNSLGDEMPTSYARLGAAGKARSRVNVVAPRA